MPDIDLDAIEARIAAVVLPTEDDPNLYRLDPTEGCWIAYRPVDCVGEDELPADRIDLAALLAELRATTADLAVAVEVARERGEEIATWHQRLADVQAEYRTAAEYWDQQRERLKTEVGRLLAVAEAARDLDDEFAASEAGAGDLAYRAQLRARLRAALDAWRAGGGAA